MSISEKIIVNNQWYGAESAACLNLPSTLSEWLFDPVSMTVKLEKTRGFHATFQLLKQKMGSALPEEADYLGIELSDSVRLREVVWVEKQVCWLLGHCVLPQLVLQVNGALLSRWGHRPIGCVLFEDPHLTRSAIQIARIDAQHPYDVLVSPLSSSGSYWVRRSLFHYYGAPLLVCEIFFTPFLNFIGVD